MGKDYSSTSGTRTTGHEVEPLTSYPSNPKWILALNIKAKTTKSLAANIAVNIHDLGLDNSFFRYGTKGKKKKTK